MTELLREWLLGIVAVSLLSSFAISLAGDSSARRVIRLMSAFALILAVALPLQRIQGLSFSFEELLEEYQGEVAAVSASTEEFLAALTREQLEEQVMTLAGEMQIDCQIQTTMRVEEIYALPTACAITIREPLDPVTQRSFSEKVEEVLGVAPDIFTGR